MNIRVFLNLVHSNILTNTRSAVNMGQVFCPQNPLKKSCGYRRFQRFQRSDDLRSTGHGRPITSIAVNEFLSIENLRKIFCFFFMFKEPSIGDLLLNFLNGFLYADNCKLSSVYENLEHACISSCSKNSLLYKSFKSLLSIEDLQNIFWLQVILEHFLFTKTLNSHSS